MSNSGQIGLVVAGTMVAAHSLVLLHASVQLVITERKIDKLVNENKGTAKTCDELIRLLEKRARLIARKDAFTIFTVSF